MAASSDRPAVPLGHHLRDALDLGLVVAAVPAGQPLRPGEPVPLLPRPQHGHADTAPGGRGGDGEARGNIRHEM